MSLAASFCVRKAAFRSPPGRINERRHVPATKVREIAAMLKAIHASEDIVAACEKAIRVIEKLRALQLTKAVELAEAAVEESLTYYAPRGELAAHLHHGCV